MAEYSDTICAVATPAGRGGVSIVRLSGPEALPLCRALCRQSPAPNIASPCRITDADGQLIDKGMVICFAGPRSFTGEDVCEFHLHGSPVVTDMVLKALVAGGARLARPGEFSERAFLNDKMDLAQAEAVADLIGSASVSAARFSLRSLEGEFSALINNLEQRLTALRIYIEAALDFPEEEVDFLGEGAVAERLDALLQELETILRQAQQGALVREGITVAIVGAPNAGKSTLLNALAAREAAIVTDIPGTTRDILQQEINLDGLPLHIVDTAGLRDSDDPVEAEGIRRARDAMQRSDLILLLVDATGQTSVQDSPVWSAIRQDRELADKTLLVINKIDLTGQPAGPGRDDSVDTLAISARQGAGLDALKDALKTRAGFMTGEEGGFIARRRHLLALEQARDHLHHADRQMRDARAGELVADDLLRAHNALGEITGKVTPDDLLGRIFSSFCIGK